MTRSKIRTSGAEGLTLSSTSLTVANGLTLTDGDVTLASGHGLSFAATADSSGTMSSELLDDYEEGTFTPVLADASSGGNVAGGTYVGDYTKIGNLVYVTITNKNIATSGLTSSNQVFIRGLPFGGLTRTNMSQHFVIRGDDLNVASDCYGLVAVLVSGVSYLQINENRDSTADTAFTVAGIESSSSDIFITGCYIAD